MARSTTAARSRNGTAKRGTSRPRKRAARPPAARGRAKANPRKRRQQFLSPEISAAITERLLQILGLVLLVAAALLTVALVTYHSSDPSMNAATSSPPRNLLGVYGAWLSDLLLQQIGLASVLIVIVLIVWGIRLIRALHMGAVWWRLLLLPAAIVMAVIALESTAPDSIWPVAGPGGVSGRMLFGAAQQINDSTQAGLSITVIGVIALVSALLLLIPVMGLTWAEWRALGGRGRRAVIGDSESRQLRGDRRQAAREARKAARAAARREKQAARKKRVAALPPPPIDDDDPEDRVSVVELLPKVAITKTRPSDTPKSAPARPERVARRIERAPKPSPAPAPSAAKPRRVPQQQGVFTLPQMDLLQAPSSTAADGPDPEALEQNARILETVLQDFGVKGRILKVRPGPVVTLYELEPEAGVRASRVVNLSDDIARSMSAVSARVAVIPGRNVIGIELPNQMREMVLLRELLASAPYEASKAGLPLALGKDISGAPIIADLTKMPHLLIAGTTGSGKSVGINAMILSLLYRLTPEQCKLIMIDPKMLELSVYDDIPHLLTPVVTEPKKAVVALRWAVREMESRYQAMSKLGVRNIAGFNKRLAEARRKGEVLTEKVTGAPGPDGSPVIEERPIDLTPIPYIVVVVDEMADLMLVAGKDIEAAVQRLAQMARAAGIHLIMATQRPSVDVITGTIKANFPTRISFQVTSKIDSRTILGEQGSESLLGQGDMLYMAGGGKLSRVHGPFVSDQEVEQVSSFLRSQGEPTYIEEVTREDETIDAFGAGGDDNSADADLYRQAVEIVINEGKCSISLIQRKLQIGYNRAARLVERMEDENIISEADHRGKREVLVGAA